MTFRSFLKVGANRLRGTCGGGGKGCLGIIGSGGGGGILPLAGKSSGRCGKASFDSMFDGRIGMSVFSLARLSKIMRIIGHLNITDLSGIGGRLLNSFSINARMGVNFSGLLSIRGLSAPLIMRRNSSEPRVILLLGLKTFGKKLETTDLMTILGGLTGVMGGASGSGRLFSR